MRDALAPCSDGSCLPSFQSTSDPVQFAGKDDPATLLRRLAGAADGYDPVGVIAAAGPVRRAVRAW